MKKSDLKTLIIGIGNNGRQDDGLGWAFLDILRKEQPLFDLEYRYQLQIEDAEYISGYQHVIFVDATKETTENGFYYKPCMPRESYNFSTHALSPQTIMSLSKTLYDTKVSAWLFAIQGFEWELQIGLSKKGAENLKKASLFFKDEILSNYIVKLNT
jgi:hydrogenase maturation protease